MLQIQELWQKPNVVSSLDQSLTSIRGQSARGPALWNQKGFPASKAFNTLFDDNLLFHCTLYYYVYYIIIILDYIILDYIILYIIYQKEQLQHYIIYYIYILTKRSALTLSSLSSATLIWT